eukprot:365580-Chlamydomonas_euryale.AAC.9
MQKTWQLLLTRRFHRRQACKQQALAAAAAERAEACLDNVMNTQHKFFVSPCKLSTGFDLCKATDPAAGHQYGNCSEHPHRVPTPSSQSQSYRERTHEGTVDGVLICNMHQAAWGVGAVAAGP